MASERRVVNFSGKVQGVFFRATCEKLARNFTITGFVRNEPDGSVHLEAQGEADEIDRFVAAIHEAFAGRRPGRIDAARVSPAETMADETGFRIQR